MNRKGEFDPVLLEVMNNELGAVCDEMAFTMRRAARSFAGREGGDFMVGLVDKKGDLIARSNYALGSWYVPMVMPWVIRKYDGKLQERDIVVTNDPYGGGSHLNDIILVMPIFWEGELVAFTGSALHHADVGGRTAGGMSPSAEQVFEEGLRLPAVLLHQAGVPNTSVFDVIEANTRAPGDVLGDLEGQVVSCWRGEEGYLRLVRKYSLEVVTAYGQYLLDYSERQIRDGIAALPDGEWISEYQVDDDGMGGEGPRLVQQVKVKGDTLTIDHTGTAPQQRTAINRPPRMTWTMGNDTVRHAMGLEVPVNSGVMAPIEIIAPPGTVANPRFPAAVGGRALTLSQGQVAAALAIAAPERVPAADSGPPNILIYASRDDDGRPRVLFDLYQNGTGGRPNGDGVDGGGRNEAGGGLLGTPVELIEQEHPIVVEGFGFAPDTGGAGKFRGAISVYRRWRFLKDGHLHVRNFHYDRVPNGVAGGRNGTRSKIMLESDSRQVELPAHSHIELEVRAGDVLTHISAGPGGHGDPWERDPQRVLEDFLDEKITPPYAEREYGVVINADGMQIDQESTAKVRKQGRPVDPDMPEPSITVTPIG